MKRGLRLGANQVGAVQMGRDMSPDEEGITTRAANDVLRRLRRDMSPDEEGITTPFAVRSSIRR